MKAFTLFGFVAVYMGWQLFADGPLAYYMACGALVAVLSLQLARAKGREWWPIYGYGAAMGLMSTTCGGLYASKADGFHFLCDRGTGLPVSLIAGAAAILVGLVAMHRE